MNKWFTTDWHLGHYNIMKYCNRPFDTTEEMDSTIISNFNDTVHAGDVVYYLGDFSFANIDEYFARLRQDITMFFIVGNHDKKIREIQKQRIIQGVYHLRDIKIEDQPITLCHYPMMSFNKSHYNAWQLYGHHHTDTNSSIPGKRFNVAIDLHSGKPLSLSEIKAEMDKRENNWDFINPKDRR